MKCPRCGNELEEGKLLCEKCGEEVKIVPDFDIELEAKLSESINSMLKEMSAEELTDETVDNIEQTKVIWDDYYEEDDDDIKDELRDYFPDKSINIQRWHKIAIVFVVVIVIAGIVSVAVNATNKKRENSYDYQYEQAIVYAAENNYEEAINHLERALAINSGDLDASLLLAKYYDKNNQRRSAVLVLNEILNTGTDYERRDEVYDLLLSISEEQADYEQMGELLRDCDVPRILSKYNKYAALAPEFNKSGGVYDEIISITLTGNTQGFVYYTLDGSVPTSNSMVYETPILLESGDYIIRAKFVNMYGVESEVVSQSYYISLSAPAAPVVNYDSGTYDEPLLIEVYHDDDTKIYYTVDGSVPTKNSSRYTDPIEMPYGVSNFAFVAINTSGLSSEIVNRTYQLNIQANFTTELALQVLINNLWANGTLVDLEGHVPNRLGFNQYRVETVARVDENMYYIVYEQYVDTTGKAHDTSSIYAVDVNTADLFRAYKLDEGQYYLKDF